MRQDTPNGLKGASLLEPSAHRGAVHFWEAVKRLKSVDRSAGSIPAAWRECCRLEEAACVLMVMVEFLFGGDLLVFVLLAPHALFLRRLDAGFREIASAHREP